MTTPQLDEPKDLGFGSVVGGVNEKRLLNRDGTFNPRRHGLPILGDDLYGAGGAERLMLHASQLIFPHPITGREVSIESPLPEDFRRYLTIMRSSRTGDMTRRSLM